MTFACGLAREGMTPVVSTYSTFMQRAYDQILHDAALNRLHVVFCLDRAGLPGADGTTHQGIYDLSYLGGIPGMAVLSPATYDELTRMTEFAVNEYDGPIAIRYPKGKEKLASVPDFEFGRAKVLSDGGDITLVTEGMMTKTALDAAKKSGRSVEVIELSTVYPVDLRQ